MGGSPAQYPSPPSQVVQPFHISGVYFTRRISHKWAGLQGEHSLCLHLTTLGMYVVLHHHLGAKPFGTSVIITHPMVPSVISIILLSITFFHRLDKAILFAMEKTYLSLQKWSVIENLIGIICNIRKNLDV